MRRIRLLILSLFILLPLAACSTVKPTWQPAPGEPAVAVHVYRTAIHTILGLPPEKNSRLVEEWSFGQKLWFYDTQTTSSSQVWEALRLAWFYSAGVLSAGFYPSRGVVEVVHASRPLPQREPEEWVGGWTFYLSPAELSATRAWLRASLEPGAMAIYSDDESTYWPSRRKYWTFYTCHHYAAQALQAGGIPAGAGRGWNPWWLWGQLSDLEAAPARPAGH